VRLAELDRQLRGARVQRRSVLTGVVPAEQQLTAGRQDGSEDGRGAAAVAAVEPGQVRSSHGAHRRSLLRLLEKSR
jgi:hypothetical protein